MLPQWKSSNLRFVGLSPNDLRWTGTALKYFELDPKWGVIDLPIWKWINMPYFYNHKRFLYKTFSFQIQGLLEIVAKLMVYRV
jgi:hypothetical protein